MVVWSKPSAVRCRPKSALRVFVIPPIGHIQRLPCDIKSFLHANHISDSRYVTSQVLDLRVAHALPGYLDGLKHRNQLLRILVEDEMYRMGVWANPMSDAKRGTDHVVSAEKSMTDVGALTRFSSIRRLLSHAGNLDDGHSYRMAAGPCHCCFPH